MLKRLWVLFAATVLIGSAWRSWGSSIPSISSTRLIVSKTSASLGDIVVLTADVSISGEQVTKGSVVFLEDGVPLATTQIVGISPAAGFRTGSAVLKRCFSTGTHQLTAKFTGYGQTAASVSDPVDLTVFGAPRGVLIIAPDPAMAPSVRFSLTSSGLDPPDGTVDLLAVSSGESIGSLHLSKGSVQLVDGVTSFSSGGSPAAFALGDFNGDGSVDLAVADPEQGRVGIFLTPSDDLLPGRSIVSFATGGRPVAIATSDLNGDGVLDLVILDGSAGSLTVWLGDPDHAGSFVALDGPIPLSQGLSNLTIADLNADGLPDLAVTNAVENTVTILLGETFDPGRFKLTQTIALSGGPYAIASGDVYGNGLPDLAVASFQSGEVWTLQNDPISPGSFIVPSHVQKVGNGPYSILIADVAGDDIPDIVVCNSLDSNVSILLGVASNRGTFPTEQIIEVGAEPVAAAAILERGKSKPNLVISNSRDGTLEVLENDGSGVFPKHRVITAGSNTSQVDTFVANGSAYPVIVTLDSGAGVVHLVQQEWWTDGTFVDISPPANGQGFMVQARAILGGEQILSNQLTMSSDQASQAISFEPTTDGSYGQSVTLAARASSGLPVQFRIASGSATIVGAELIPSSAGIVTVEATQEGSLAFTPAALVSRSIRIAPATLRVVAAAAERRFGASNPPFTGNMIGLVAGDPVQVSYNSVADATTAPGIYRDAPVAVTPILHDPDNRLSNYQVVLTSAPFTISSAPTQSQGTPLSPGDASTPPPDPGNLSPQQTSTSTSASDPTSGPADFSTSAPPANSVLTTDSPSSGSGPASSLFPVALSPSSEPAPTSPLPSEPGPASSSPVSNGGLPPTASPVPPVTMPNGSQAPATKPVPPAVPPVDPGPLKSRPVFPVQMPTHSPLPVRAPITLSIHLPDFPIHALIVPIPAFGWHWSSHEKKLTPLNLRLYEGGPEPTLGNVLLSVAIDPTSGQPPIGQVSVIERGRILAVSPLSGFFTIRVLLHALSPGKHQFSVRFSGDSHFASSASNYLDVDVPAGPDNPSTSLPDTEALNFPSSIDEGQKRVSQVGAIVPPYSPQSIQTIISTSRPREGLQSIQLDLNAISTSHTTYQYFSETATPQQESVDAKRGHKSVPSRSRTRGRPASLPLKRRGTKSKRVSTHKNMAAADHPAKRGRSSRLHMR